MGPDPRKPSGPAVQQHRINRPNTRLYLTQSLHRQIILATREPSTQDIRGSDANVRLGSKTEVSEDAYDVRFLADFVLCGWLPDCKDFVGVAFWSGAVLCPAC